MTEKKGKDQLLDRDRLIRLLGGSTLSLLVLGIPKAFFSSTREFHFLRGWSPAAVRMTSMSSGLAIRSLIHEFRA